MKWQFIVASIAVLSACGQQNVYTLYRNSMTDSSMRVHVATFDASSGDKYNQANCEIAMHLFMEQPGVKTRFWCEKGAFKL